MINNIYTDYIVCHHLSQGVRHAHRYRYVHMQGFEGNTCSLHTPYGKHLVGHFLIITENVLISCICNQSPTIDSFTHIPAGKQLIFMQHL